MTAKTSPHVLIVGAGLAGLVLAQALRKQGISYEVFERDVDIHSRFQGWAIALHQILPDLRASLPKDLGDVEVTNHLLPLDITAQFNFWTDGKLVSSYTQDDSHPLVRANRRRLRDFLAQHLNINWNKQYTSIEESPEAVTLRFSDGTSATGDILVAADGVHSKIRTHLLPGPDPLQNVPLGMIGAQLRVEKKDYERQFELGHSVYVADVSSGQRIFVGLNDVAPDASYATMYWMVSWPEKELGSDELSWTYHADRKTLREAAIKQVSALEPRFQEIVHLTKEEDILEPAIVLRDILLDSLPSSRITLVGDAAHAMTPFRGQGGNMAMQDSLNLARTIVRFRDEAADRDTILAGLQEHANEMLTRTRPIVEGSRAAAMNEGNQAGQLVRAWEGGNAANKKANGTVDTVGA